MKKINQRNLVGQKFGKLLAIESLGNNGKGHYLTKVRCDCGLEYIVRDTELINGRRTGCKSCNCSFAIHRKTNTRLFNIWQAMKYRCLNKNCKVYKYYGSRGIKICEEWQNDFMAFYNWAIENDYKENLSLDRIDNNGNYEPNNCRWTNKYVQANNKRNNVYIKYKNKDHTIAELSKIYNINYGTLRNRIKRGWNVSKAINEIVVKGRNQYWKSV